jgi:hypothetical protein
MRSAQNFVLEELNKQILHFSDPKLRIPYVYGGRDPVNGFDCGGLVTWVLNQSGIFVPHTTANGIAMMCDDTPDPRWQGIEERLAIGVMNDHVGLCIQINSNQTRNNNLYLETTTLYSNNLGWFDVQALGMLRSMFVLSGRPNVGGVDEIYEMDWIPELEGAALVREVQRYALYGFLQPDYQLYSIRTNAGHDVYTLDVDDVLDSHEEFMTANYIHPYEVKQEPGGYWYPNDEYPRQYDQQPYEFLQSGIQLVARLLLIVRSHAELLYYTDEEGVATWWTKLINSFVTGDWADLTRRIVSINRREIYDWLEYFAQWLEDQVTPTSGVIAGVWDNTKVVHYTQVLAAAYNAITPNARTGVQVRERSAFTLKYLQRWRTSSGKDDIEHGTDYQPWLLRSHGLSRKVGSHIRRL